MNRKDLYNSFNEVDDDILERSETAADRKNHPGVKWGALAACVCLAAAIAVPRFLSDGDRDAPPAGTDQLLGGPSQGNAIAYGNTSNTYTDLPSLLAYLSDHDIHDEGKMDASRGDSISPAQGESGQPEKAELAESTGVAVDAAGKYAYHIGETAVQISLLDGKNTKNVGSIEGTADSLFICNDHLLVVSQFHSGGDELNEELSVRVSIYNITVPQAPVLREEYTQLGQLTACWMVGANLYLVTSDGVCACGWSRLRDTSGYYPVLSHNGEAMEWGDEDISILGEPTRVQYSAITAINGNTCEVVEKEALYGNILKLFYGEDWIAVTVASEMAKDGTISVLYTFHGDLSFDGRINAAHILEASEQNEQSGHTPQSERYLNIVSVSKAGGLYRLLGTDTGKDGENITSYFMAISANMETGEAAAALLSAEGYPYGTLTEILWEPDRAVVCVGVMYNMVSANADIEQETRFIFAQFNGPQVKFFENELTAARLDGRVGMFYGNPLGKFETLIPMGQGIYVRYSHPAEGPGGFDVFDFSDSAAPRLLYHSKTSLSGEDAFDYAWYVYDEHTFGTLKILLGAEDYFRDVNLSWCVFSVNPAEETAVKLQQEYPLDKEIKTFFGADVHGYAVFHAGNDVYYVMKDMMSAASVARHAKCP